MSFRNLQGLTPYFQARPTFVGLWLWSINFSMGWLILGFKSYTAKLMGSMLYVIMLMSRYWLGIKMILSDLLQKRKMILSKCWVKKFKIIISKCRWNLCRQITNQKIRYKILIFIENLINCFIFKFEIETYILSLDLIITLHL